MTKNIDYIIVGFGLAGMAFAKTLKDNNKSFVIISNRSQNASLVAAGMFNPVILKRFSAVWNGVQQLQVAIPFYQDLEKELGGNYINYLPIYRIFKSIEEQNNWMVALDNHLLNSFMDKDIIPNKNTSVNANFGFGKLINTGVINVEKLFQDYKNHLINTNHFIEDTFDYSLLLSDKEKIEYKEITAKKIIFCEGYGVINNPFFKNTVNLKEAKGELLVIHAPDLKIDYILKSAIFIAPLGNAYYKVGATFNWEDKTAEPTQEAREELIKKLETVITCDYKITNQLAGIRPTIKDRRPVIGTLLNDKNIAILNGLGTRGVLLAPTMAGLLFESIENKQELPNEVSILRFYNK